MESEGDADRGPKTSGFQNANTKGEEELVATPKSKAPGMYATGATAPEVP